ncbi:hypothetical protein D3C86_1166780 [compost metagenome]
MRFTAHQPKGIPRDGREGDLGRARHLACNTHLHLPAQHQPVHVLRRLIQRADADVGMAARVALQQAGQPLIGQRRHDRQRHGPRIAHAQLPRRIQHAVMRGQQFAQQRRHRQTQRRQLRPLAGFKQRRAQLLFQVLHGGGHGGLRPMRAFGRQPEAAMVGRQQELAQVLDLQRGGHDGRRLTSGFPKLT